MPSSAGKPTIYVSSTFVDLKEHRAALKIALERAGFDVECMEKYPAFDERPLDHCLADVAACDVYVRSFGWGMRGTVPSVNLIQIPRRALERQIARTR